MSKNFEKKIAVIGLGYIGLPTSIFLANSGYEVIGVDINEKVIKSCKDGKLHIVEPGLQEYFDKALKSKNLSFSLIPKESEIYIICVPTPFKENESNIPEPDISFLESAVSSIKPKLKNNDLIIIESTSPIGTTKQIENILLKDMASKKIHIAYCPERVLPGNIIEELIHNDRIVGGIDDESTKLAKEFYETVILGSVYGTDSTTAETSKLVENGFRDLNIAFANELSMFCDTKGINPYELIELANKHPRVNIMKPGIGVGGHCIAVDPWFLISSEPNKTKLSRLSREINIQKSNWALQKIVDNLIDFNKPKIAFLGLAYKPDINDLRESPSEYIALELDRKYEIFCVEPNIDNHKNLKLYNLDDALEKADIVVLSVAHKEFLNADIKKKLLTKRVLDFCGII